MMEIIPYFTDITTSITATLTIIIVTFIFTKIILSIVRKDNTPPGPTGLPVVGFLPFLGATPNLTFTKLREKYGDIFSVQMGSFPAVIINGKTLIKEAFVNRGDDFSGRPNFYSSSIIGTETLTFGHFSEATIEHKKLASNCLYMYANARKNPIEDIVDCETNITVSDFLKMNGEPFNPKDMIFLMVGSVIYQICYGKDCNIRVKDSVFAQFIKRSSAFTKFLGSGNPIDVLPFLRFFMPWKVTQFVEVATYNKEIQQDKARESMKTFSPSHMRHLTDGLIAADKERESNPDRLMTKERIFSTLEDITGAGVETVSTTLSWTVLLLAAYPDVQTKLHQEIDDVIGKRPPRLQDKAAMNYCMATINEIMRYSNITPLSIPHAATKDTELEGFTIRKGTVIIANMYSISHDKETWEDPLNFRPERYLDADGRLDKTRTAIFSAFSMGRRKCLGEFLARMEVFLFTAGMLQHCKFTKPSHIKEYSLESIFGLTNSPAPYEVCVSARD